MKFQSTPPARGATLEPELPEPRYTISIHAPREGGDRNHSGILLFLVYFNPRPPRGGRRSPLSSLRNPPVFQSTPPARGATFQLTSCPASLIFQSTPPARGATGGVSGSLLDTYNFNPRPPRGGRPYTRFGSLYQVISIHAPREGGDRDTRPTTTREMPRTFQSTPPARGATSQQKNRLGGNSNFNPRPPRGGRHGQHHAKKKQRGISIHAPREGGDKEGQKAATEAKDFNPRPPRGGRHRICWLILSRPYDFNPRPPRGGRLGFFNLIKGSKTFQSTPPARGATQSTEDTMTDEHHFNPRPPRGGRRRCWSRVPRCWYFNPRPPRGGRLKRLSCLMISKKFQSTPPARGATNKTSYQIFDKIISIHAPREGGD